MEDQNVFATVTVSVCLAALRSFRQRIHGVSSLARSKEVANDLVHCAEIDGAGNVTSIVFVTETAVDNLEREDGVGIFASEKRR